MINPIGPIVGPREARPAEPAARRPDGSFLDILAEEAARQAGLRPAAEPGAGGEAGKAPAPGPERAGDVRFSAHAQQRLDERQIVLTDQHHARLGDAVARADEKGANQSLVLLDDLALVVSVRNRVVITALDESKARTGVFTNIDSAVIA